MTDSVTPAELKRVHATSADSARAYAVLEEATAWLRSKGIAQWDELYPRARFEREVEEGLVWVWKREDEIVATVTLHAERPEYYPTHVWTEGADAWYVCRFAVARAYSGTGLGAQLLRELERDALTVGKGALRLDVTAANPFLHAYYAALGFDEHARHELAGDEAIFLEKALRE